MERSISGKNWTALVEPWECVVYTHRQKYSVDINNAAKVRNYLINNRDMDGLTILEKIKEG